MEAYFHVVFAPSGCCALDDVDGQAPSPQTLHGDFDQVLCVMSKARDGAIIVDQNNCVTATGQIVSLGESDPTDIKTAFLHFHAFGEPSPEGAWSYLLLPVTSSCGAGKRFACPIHCAEGMMSDHIKSEQTMVSVLAADKSNSIVVKELDYDDPSSESASDCLWFAETTAGALWRLYVTPDGVRKLYMAADGSGHMFLTEDEPLSIQREGMENPATIFRLYLKYHAVEAC